LSIQSSSEHFVSSARFQVPDISEETTCGAGVADAQALNRVRVVPPPSDGQKIFQIDPMLQGYKYHLEYRYVLLASTAPLLNISRRSPVCHDIYKWLPQVSRFSCYLNSCILLVPVILHSVAGRSYE
jgi:hypothetical protein